MSMRQRGILLGLVAFWGAAGAGNDELAEALHRCGRGADGAHDALVAWGPPALPHLAAEIAQHEQSIARLRAAAAAIQATALQKQVQFRIGLPKMQLTTELVNSASFKFNVYAKNLTDKPVRLWPYFGVRLLDANGAEIKPRGRRGRWGRLESGCFLEEVPFARVEAGARRTVEGSLKRYGLAPHTLLGYRVPGPGRYTLELTYDYDRAREKARCPAAFRARDHAERHWNHALEGKAVFTVPLRVR